MSKTTAPDTQLSPAAQAVLDAFAADNYGVWLEGDPDRIAAALRVMANDWRVDTEFIDGVEYIRTTTLEKIATELEDT